MPSPAVTRQHRPVCLWSICCVPVLCAILLSISSANLFAQHAVDPGQRYHRLICLVHFTGSGTHDDPIRPEYIPVRADARSREGIIAWSVLPTDDGKMAIIHVVAADRNAFAPILADTRPEVKVFEIGKDSKAVIEASLQMYRKSFSLDAFRVVAQ